MYNRKGSVMKSQVFIDLRVHGCGPRQIYEVLLQHVPQCVLIELSVIVVPTYNRVILYLRQVIIVAHLVIRNI